MAESLAGIYGIVKSWFVHPAVVFHCGHMVSDLVIEAICYPCLRIAAC